MGYSRQKDPDARKQLDRLTDEDWMRILANLVRYARALILVALRDRLKAQLVDEEDLAMQAFLCLDGSRQWNTQIYPDLQSFLRSVVRSNVSHLRTSKEARTTSPLSTNPDSLPSAEDEANDCRDLREFVLHALPPSDRPELGPVVDAILTMKTNSHGTGKSGRITRQIADDLGISYEQARQRLRKLERRLSRKDLRP